MKKVVIIIILLPLLYSCGDYPLRVCNMHLYSIVNTKTSEPSTIKGWYHSEFQNELLNFSIEFGTDGIVQAWVDYYWDNYPDEQSIKITCNKDVCTTNADTIKAGQLLNNCFSTTKFEKNYDIDFLISEESNNDYEFSEQYYTFYVTIETSKNEIFKDSCIVKRF